MKFEQGQIITFTSGSYSDYGLMGTVVTLMELNLAVLAQLYTEERKSEAVAENREWDYDYAHEYSAFLGWLCANQYVVAVDEEVVHLGNYSNFAPEFKVPEMPLDFAERRAEYEALQSNKEGAEVNT